MMPRYVTVDVVCPCGYRLESRRVDAESNSGVRGVKHCPVCKQKVRYSIRGDQVYTCYDPK